MSDVVLRCENLSKKYRTFYSSDRKSLKALQNVSFEFKKGDRIGILGLNGSGKSTLLKILSGQIKPTSGKVELSYMPTALSHFDSMLHPDLTGRENIKLHLKQFSFDKYNIKQAIEEVIIFSELNNFIDKPVKTYSSGMMLRLSFSMFKVVSPKILLLDEVLSAGDAVFQSKIDLLFSDFLKSSEVIVMASHNLTEIVKYCNKCLLLDKGELITFDLTEAVVKLYMNNKILKLPDYKSSFFQNLKLPIKSDSFTLVGMSLENKGMANGLNVSESFDIVLTIDKHTDFDTIEPVIDIYSTIGVHLIKECPVFKYRDFNHVMNSGLFEYRCTVSKNLFNAGDYYIDLSFCKNQRIVIDIFEKIVFFNLVQTRSNEVEGYEEVFQMKLQNKALFNPDLSWSCVDKNKNYILTYVN